MATASLPVGGLTNSKRKRSDLDDDADLVQAGPLENFKDEKASRKRGRMRKGTDTGKAPKPRYKPLQPTSGIQKEHVACFLKNCTELGQEEEADGELPA